MSIKNQTLSPMKSIKIAATALVLLSMISCENSDKSSSRESNDYDTYEETSSYDSEYELEESDEIEEASSSISSSEIDEMLDSYEEYVDQYIVFYKKAMEGNDMEAMQEYPALLEKSQELNEKLDAMQGDMSASQMGRMARIQNKILNMMNS